MRIPIRLTPGDEIAINVAGALAACIAVSLGLLIGAAYLAGM